MIRTRLAKTVRLIYNMIGETHELKIDLKLTRDHIQREGMGRTYQQNSWMRRTQIQINNTRSMHIPNNVQRYEDPYAPTS